MPSKVYKERRLYFFTFDSCGNKNRQSFHRRKIRAGVCRSCKRGQMIDPNQGILFPSSQEQAAKAGTIPPTPRERIKVSP